MKSFGFTKKKFLSLSASGQNRHVIAWLSRIYQTLAASRVSQDQFRNFYTQYKMVSAWMDRACPKAPESSDTREQLAYVSDAVHSCRILSGKVLRDHDLMDKVMTRDREIPPQDQPDMDYQVALDGLRSLFNVGSIFRTCDAAGVQTLILGNSLGKESPQVKKTAMGAQEWIHEEKTHDLVQTLMEKKKEGYTIIGVETMKNSQACHDYAWPQKAVIVVGNEEYGISPHVLGVLDEAVHIPMFGKKNSMNVANALSAVLYQAVFSRMARSI